MAVEKKKEVAPPRTPVSQEELEEVRAGVTAVEVKGNAQTGKSTLFHHPGIDIWSVAFVLPGSKVSTWTALPNERIARGAYAGGPPYDDSNPKGG